MGSEKDVLAALKASGANVVSSSDQLEVGVQTDDEARIAGSLLRLTVFESQASELTDQGFQHIRGMRKLHKVNIFNTEVSGAGLAVLPTLPGLTELHCNPKVKGDEGLAYIGKCLGLKRLGMGYSVITDEGFSSLSKLENLEDIDLSGTPISGNLRVLLKMRTLRKLNLGDTHVGDDVLSTIGELKSLKDLYLSNTAISDDGLERISKHESLETLAISGTRISAKGLTHVARMSRINYMFVHDMPLEDDALRILGAMKRLTCLFIDRRSAQEQRELQSQLPKCEIHWLPVSEKTPK